MKVKNRHFRRAKCLDSVALDILRLQCEERSTSIGEGFCDVLREFDARLSRESHRGVEILCAQRRNCSSNIKLLLNGKEIGKTQSVKYLGLLIDDKLKWINHIDNVYNKIIKLCWNFFL